MENVLASRFAALQPAIKSRWTAALRLAPALAPAPSAGLVRSSMLVFLVDDTLNRLSASLRQPAVGDRPRPGLGPLGVMRRGGQCGLHILMSYYAAGARALRATLPAELGPARVEVMRHFNRLAHEEMAALCGPCRHRGGPLCCLRTGGDARASGPA